MLLICDFNKVAQGGDCKCGGCVAPLEADCGSVDVRGAFLRGQAPNDLCDAFFSSRHGSFEKVLVIKAWRGT